MGNNINHFIQNQTELPLGYILKGEVDYIYSAVFIDFVWYEYWVAEYEGGVQRKLRKNRGPKIAICRQELLIPVSIGKKGKVFIKKDKDIIKNKKIILKTEEASSIDPTRGSSERFKNELIEGLKRELIKMDLI